MIYLIYAPSERSLIEPIAEQLSQTFDVKLAPPGLMAGSDEWKKIVETDIKSCKAAVLLVTEMSAPDETVAWRYKVAKDAGLQILPIFWNDVSRHTLLDKLHPDLNSIMMFQGVAYYSMREGDKGIAYTIQLLSKIVPPKPKQVKCFVSYSRSDTDFAAKLSSDLRASNVETWRDAENIPAGANWDREIEKALTNCTHVLFIASPQSIASENVLDELGLALNKQKTVIPIMLETCDLPLRVHRAQWVDFRGDYQTAFKALLEHLIPK